jgi:hypothetical protein
LNPYSNSVTFTVVVFGCRHPVALAADAALVPNRAATAIAADAAASEPATIDFLLLGIRSEVPFSIERYIGTLCDVYHMVA